MRDYVIALIARDQRRPTLEEWLEEIAMDPPVGISESPAAAVRAGREERERDLEGGIGGGHGGSGR